MFENFTSILFLIFFRFDSSNSQAICEPITQDINEKVITWDIHLKDNLYRSTPLCLNEHFKIIERSCDQNIWDEEPQCNNLQEDVHPCPEEFLYYKEKDICYTVLKNQQFPPICPYNNVVGFFEYIDIFTTGLVETPVWFPASTVPDYGIGNVVVTEQSKYYGEVISISLFWKETFNKQCISYQPTLNFQPVYCNGTYDFVCAYRPLKIKETNACSRKLKKECVASSFNYFEAKCFCKQEEMCTNASMAEFQKPYQNIFASNCNFGLYHANEKVIWRNTQEGITYSNWNKDVDFRNSFGVILEDGTWSLQEEESPVCSICQEDIIYNIPKISLKFDKEGKRLVLTVDHIEDLHLPDERQVPIFCFSDTNSYIDTFSVDVFDDYEVIREQTIVYYFKYSQNCPGHYWCEAFELPTFKKIKTGKILVFDEEYYGNEYAAILILNFRTAQTVDPFNHEIFLAELTESDDPFYLRWISTLGLNEETMTVEYLIHVTSKSFQDVQIEYYEFYDRLQTRISELDFVILTDLKSVSYCLPDMTKSDSITLHWPLTKVNATTTPDEFCLEEDGTPVFRVCTGDFLYGAKWLPVNGSCSKNPTISSITTSLYDLLHTNETMEDKINDLAEMTGNTSNYLPVDIHYIAEIIEKTDKQTVSCLESLTKVIDNLVSTQKETLKTSQDLLNSTDKLLYNFDLLVENFYDRKRRSYYETEIITKNIMVYVFNTKVSHTTGIAVCNTENGYVVKKLSRNVTLEGLLKEKNLVVATYIPEKLLQQISDSLIESQPLIVSITVFLNDYLFNEDHLDTKEVVGSIFGILLPKIKDEFKAHIPIVYKSVQNAIEKQCSYWHYGSPNEFANIKGKWELDKKPKEEEDGEICMFGHTTHFALLIFSDVSKDKNIVLSNYTYLNVITTLGCGLSIFGILGILITAILFKPWRASKGNQILIQYSIVTLLQICLLYAASNVDHEEDHVLCVVLGAFLHYDVLSQFCWMLVMAILHYQRFVLVFKQQHSWIILKSSVIGYIFPTVPVIINITVCSDNYTVGTTGICYPTGEALYIWLLVPVGCIVLTNLSIFCIIIRNIFRKKLHDDYGQDYIFVLKLRLVVVLFSTLGITWVFGFAAEIFSSILCTYLFCLTASLQGFILFLAFIVFNATTRRMYWFFMKTLKLRIQMRR